MSANLRVTRRALAAGFAAMLIASAACGRRVWVSPAVRPVEVTEVGATLFLVGDMGEVEGTPSVLEDLKSEAASMPPGSAGILFLGDNVYPRGVPALGEPESPPGKSTLVLRGQAELLGSLSRYYVPGNHDWDQSGSRGWERVVREAALVKETGGSFMPTGGCPGPETFVVGSLIRVIAIDSEWFLRDEFDRVGAGRGRRLKPGGRESGCRLAVIGSDGQTLAEEIHDLPSRVNETHPTFAAVRRLVEGDGSSKVFVIAMHHPVASHGPHGGFTDPGEAKLLAPLFPLRPLVCPISQDLCHARYVAYVNALKGALRGVRGGPIVFASGHEHSLQLLRVDLEGRDGAFQIVSGAGSRATGVANGDPDTMFKAGRRGYVRLDVGPEAGRPVSARARCETETANHPKPRIGPCSGRISLW